MTDDRDSLRDEIRHLRAQIHHLTGELKDAHERIAGLAQELVRVRAKPVIRGLAGPRYPYL